MSCLQKKWPFLDQQPTPHSHCHSFLMCFLKLHKRLIDELKSHKEGGVTKLQKKFQTMNGDQAKFLGKLSKGHSFKL